MISLLFWWSSVVLLFSLVLHHFRIVSTEKTQNAACKDILVGKSRVRAMLLQENSKLFFLVTSSGDIFIEPMKNLDHAASPPTITLTEAKTHMKPDWHIRDKFETHTGNTDHFLALRRNPDQVKETFLVLIKTDAEYICGYFGFKLDLGKEAEPSRAVDICCKIHENSVPDFWLGLLSQPLGMVWTKASKGREDRYAYCIIYSFPDPKKGDSLKCESVSPWEPESQCLGYIAEGIEPKDRPLAGFMYWDGDIAVLVHNTSNVYVYKNIRPSSGKLKEKKSDLSEPSKYQINEFIKCHEPKVNKNPKPPKKEELDKNQDEPADSNDIPDYSEENEEDLTTDSQGKQLARIMLCLGVIVLVLIGVWFLCKYNWDKVRPRKRKSMTIGDISKALAEWPQEASTPPPGKSMAPIKTPSTLRVSAIPQMLKKVSNFISRQVTPPSTTPATTTSSPLTRRVSHTSKNPSKTPNSSPAKSPAPRRQSKAKNPTKTPNSSPAKSPAPRRQSKASKASPIRPSSLPVASRKVTKKLDAIKKSLVKSLAPLKTRKKRK